MKGYSLLIWLTQLGLSIALPLGSLLLLGIWLHRSLGWGRWTLWAGLILGLAGAFSGFRRSMDAMERMNRDSSDPSPLPFSRDAHDKEG